MLWIPLWRQQVGLLHKRGICRAHPAEHWRRVFTSATGRLSLWSCAWGPGADANAEALEAIDREEFTQLAQDWKRQWPNHCKQCLGAGELIYRTARGRFSAPQQFSEPCICVESGCPRCGYFGSLWLEGLPVSTTAATIPESVAARLSKPCSNCGWSFDDQCPQWEVNLAP